MAKRTAESSKDTSAPPPVVALVGDDIFLQLRAIGKITEQIGPDAARIDFDGESAQLADVLDELRSFSMFGNHKVVVVRNADELLSRARQSLEEYVASPVGG